MKWKVNFDPRALKELQKLGKDPAQRILKFIKERLEINEDPRRVGGTLKGDHTGLWKYRIGDYRLICRIIDAKIEILIVHAGHRKNVYIIN